MSKNHCGKRSSVNVVLGQHERSGAEQNASRSKLKSIREGWRALYRGCSFFQERNSQRKPDLVQMLTQETSAAALCAKSEDSTLDKPLNRVKKCGLWCHGGFQSMSWGVLAKLAMLLCQHGEIGNQ